MNKNIRKPAVSGMFYPSEKQELKNMLSKFLNNSKLNINTDELKKIKAIIVPHAGLIYSGQMAGYAYNLIKNTSHSKFIILGPSHTTYLKDITADENQSWETPLGIVDIIPNNFSKDRNAHLEEHNLELQVIFLQMIRKKPLILPLLVGDNNPINIANSLENLIDDDTLLIISSDLSHFHNYDDAKKLDLLTIKSIENYDTSSMNEACGILPIKSVIELAKKNKWKIKKLGYYNSGDVIGDKNKVVGYTSFVLYE
jgi:MEMO1 family protein